VSVIISRVEIYQNLGLSFGKIGLYMVEFLESQNHPYKWHIDDVNDIKRYYKEQIKLL